MQFRDLKTQYQKLKFDIDKAMVEVATNCNFIMGNQVKELEQELAEYVGVKHCVSCGDGTDALELALMVWGIKEGDAVFVPDFTFFSSGEVVSAVGATPIFVDVDRKTFNLDPQKLGTKIEEIKKEGKLVPKIIVAVDLFGLPADFKALRAIADKHKMYILEDGAQGFGGTIDGQVACSFGDMATTSFFPAKPLGCYGDGGAVFTNNDEWKMLLESYRVHGKGENKYDNIRIGKNSRLDTIQAAVLKVKLQAFKDYEVSDVNKVANMYTEKLADVVITPYIPEGFTSSWAQYTIQLPTKRTRDDLAEFLKAKEIPSMIYYQKAMHNQAAFDSSLYNDADFDVTNKLVDTVLSLPMHPYMQENDVEAVVNAVKEFLL